MCKILQNIKRFGVAIITLLAITQATFAQDSKPQGALSYRGFSGGMMLHSGWVSRGDMVVGSSTQSLSGATLGIGGAVRFRFGDHLRIGTEGYTSSLGYGKWGSSLSIGWGGLLVDWCWKVRRFAPYIGATIGGGRVTNLTLTSNPTLDTLPEEQLSYRTYGVGVVVPFVGIEYPLSEHMSLVAKGDWLISLSHQEFDFPSGVRCYVGVMFTH